MADIAVNRKAFHNYEILDKYEAGIMLEGMEVKSLRGHELDMKDSYAIISNNEAWLLNMYIKPYQFDGRQEVSPTRTRKLLLNKSEIKKLMGKVSQKGYTILPLKLYFNSRNLVKVQLGLGKSKKLVDKREAKKLKDLDRDLQRELNRRG
ncbi:MAG: SsrA-binding protein SmpB [Candidatus Margulisiibacteriota bacterium]|jgi:SsrA-binding protein